MSLRQPSLRSFGIKGGLFGRLAAIFALTLTGLLLSYTSAAAQAPGEIRVVSTSVENRFPTEIVIHAMIEAEADIASVRLNYRPKSARVWTYSHLEFSRDRRVAANFKIPTSGAYFLVPGTEIEYSLAIEDVLGNVLSTEPSVLEHTDNRFSWQVAQIGPLALNYHDIPQSRVEDLKEDLEPRLKVLVDLIPVDPPADMRGIVYNHAGEAAEAFPQYSRTLTEQQVFHGFAFSPENVFLGIGWDVSLIHHEATHLLMGQAMAEREEPIPAWLEEGLATYLEPGANPYDGRSLSGRTPPLRLMDRISGTPLEITNFYRKSESVVGYLVEESGQEDGMGTLHLFLMDLKQGETVEQALLDNYGFGLEELDRRWAESGKGPAVPPPGTEIVGLPSPFLYLDTWLIGGLAIVAVVVVAGRYALGKLRPSDEPEEEGLQPWEDPDLN